VLVRPSYPFSWRHSGPSRPSLVDGGDRRDRQMGRHRCKAEPRSGTYCAMRSTVAWTVLRESGWGVGKLGMGEAECGGDV